MRMKLLIGYDGSSYADVAIDDLQNAGLPAEVDALVVSVCDEPIVPPLASHEIIEKAFVGERVMAIVNHANAHLSEAFESAEHLATTAASRVKAHFPNWHVHAKAIGGRPAAELVNEARGWGAHLIVVGSQGRSAVGRLLLGSVSLEVAIEAPCSVRIGRSDSTQNRRIVVGLDGLAGSERAIKQVLKRAWPNETELRIIAVDDGLSPIKIDEVTSASRMPSGMIKLAGAKGLKVFAEIRSGDPASVLMAEAGDWEAGCIFIGANGFGNAIYRSTNSVLTELATNASCSIEIVR